MDTYVVLGSGLGLGLLIAIWGIWNLGKPLKPVSEQHVAKDERRRSLKT
jgi:hypothetical protein